MPKSILIGIAAVTLMLGGCSKAQAEHGREEANKALILDYYREPSETKRLYFMAAEYRQHNPNIADGKAGLTAFFAQNVKSSPGLKQTVKRIAADGDLVWVHLHTVRWKGDRGLAVINIFRIADGKIAEHWDVAQPVPEHAYTR